MSIRGMMRCLVFLLLSCLYDKCILPSFNKYILVNAAFTTRNAIPSCIQEYSSQYLPSISSKSRYYYVHDATTTTSTSGTSNNKSSLSFIRKDSKFLRSALMAFSTHLRSSSDPQSKSMYLDHGFLDINDEENDCISPLTSPGTTQCNYQENNETHEINCSNKNSNIDEKEADNLFQSIFLLDTESRRQQSLDRLRSHCNQFSSSNIRPNKKKNNDGVANNVFASIESLEGELQYQQQTIPNPKTKVRQRESFAQPSQPPHHNQQGMLLGLPDEQQCKSIASNAPAILLESGPGTGKSSVLSARIAHLLRTQQTHPHNIIVISFTNRDAETLKLNALGMLFRENIDDECTVQHYSDQMKEMERRIWSGTIHSFASSILRKYAPSPAPVPLKKSKQTNHRDNNNSRNASKYHRNNNSAPKESLPSPLKVISTREMRNRVRLCLGRLSASPELHLKYKEALSNVANESIGTLVQYLVRCIELWKEAGILPPPFIYSISFVEDEGEGDDESGNESENDNKNLHCTREEEEERVREDCVELAMRLGIPYTCALLAMDIYGDYQAMHASMGTADPSDLATMAHDFLFSNPRALHAIRTKLQHVILDEYQDVSVSQHKLLRLIIRGVVDEGSSGNSNSSEFLTKSGFSNSKATNAGSSIYPEMAKSNVNSSMTKIIANVSPRTTAPIYLDKSVPKATWKQKCAKANGEEYICYNVPKLFAAGDSNQSIYGWRGAAPSLTVEGFQRDYPQGIVVPLRTSYRLSTHILNAANVLLDMPGVRVKLSSRDEDFGRGEMNSVHQLPMAMIRSFDISPAGAKSAFSNFDLGVRDKGICEAGPKNGENNPSSLQNKSPVQDMLEATRTGSAFEFGKQLLLKDGFMSESISSVYIQGLWDAREEAKFIASTIRKRSKERKSYCGKALIEMSARPNFRSTDKTRDSDSKFVKELLDSADVAVIVRSTNQLKLVEEALKNARIPYVIPGSTISSPEVPFHHLSPPKKIIGKTFIPMNMKPVQLITMHRAKGDEFDDVYLAGWTEGIFPHPSSVSSNRIHEERRLAYVALTRARQRVVLTYSFIRRVAFFGPRGERKEVTTQVEPSRFLYDLIIDDRQSQDYKSTSGQGNNISGTVWSDKVGIKEVISGQDLPPYYSMSYRIPVGFKPEGYSPSLMKRPLSSVPSKHQIPSLTSSSQQKISNQGKQIKSKCNGIELLSFSEANVNFQNTKSLSSQRRMKIADALEKVERGLRDIFDRKRGASKKNISLFRSMLNDLGIKRGTILVLSPDQVDENGESKAVDALLSKSKDKLQKRALSKCTAEQLGLYLVYIFKKYEK